MVVFGGLLVAAAIFFGIFSIKNAGSAERLRESIGPKGGMFVVRLVEKKAEAQRNLAIGTGLPGILLLGGGLFLMKKAKG